MLCNTHIVNSLHLLIGGGNLSKSLSSELAISRFSVRTKRMVSRFFCALSLCLGMCACTEPVPTDALEMRDVDTSDSTDTVTGTVTGAVWNDSVTIGFGFGDAEEQL